MGEKKRTRKKTVVTPKVEAARLELAEQQAKSMEAHKARMAEMRENSIQGAERIFTEHLESSAKRVVSIVDMEQKFTVDPESGAMIPTIDPRMVKLNLDAAKFNLECFGFRGRESAATPVVQINITQTQAEKIERFAKLSEGFAGA